MPAVATAARPPVLSTRVVRISKPFVFLALLIPFVLLVQDFRHDNLGSDPVNAITHRTGFWALWTLIGSLAITPLRRIHVQLAALVRYRRMVGLFAFFYATLHLLTYVFLFSGFDLQGALASLRMHDWAAIKTQWLAVWPTMVDDATKRRFIQVGLISWAILLALAVTSPAAVMRSMGGKNWQRLHRLVYVAAVLGAIHFWWLVKPHVMTPLRATVVLAVLLLARVGYSLLKRSARPAARPGAASETASAA